jgi:SHS family lactate transporter-like MFS transporter
MFLKPFRSLTSAQRRVFAACFLGWTLDAFDFFLLTYCLDSIAATYHVSLATAADSITWTLCMRPVGALLFGLLAEKIGRRPTLVLNVLTFSIFSVGSAFAPGFTSFLVMRALFGVAMGGEWGVGAALALESLPAQGRGFFSGLLQEGYVAGNLLAAAAYGAIYPHLHAHGFMAKWRMLFLLGAVPAALAGFIAVGVEESPAWIRGRKARKGGNGYRELVKFLPIFGFLALLMFGFNSFSHGTQDLYPTFLKHDIGLNVQVTSVVAIVGTVGAFVGGIFFGSLSERLGLESHGCDAGGGWVSDAVHGAGGVGGDSGAPERAVARACEGGAAGAGVSVGEPAGFEERPLSGGSGSKCVRGAACACDGLDGSVLCGVYRGGGLAGTGGARRGSVWGREHVATVGM